MQVVAAAIGDSRGRWLMQKRPQGKRHGGLWEFPGGKVEPGETPLAALVREVNEELSITVTVCSNHPDAVARAEAGEGEPVVVISLYKIDAWCGLPRPEPGAEIGWFTPGQMGRMPLPPLDRALAAQLFTHLA
jgi:8-oxo-dGTP diphosphatase